MKLILFQTAALLAIAPTIVSAEPRVVATPHVLERHGVIYGVRGLGFGGCETYEKGDSCTPYDHVGTIVAVYRNPESHRIEGFALRTASGRKEIENIDAEYFPASAFILIRRGRHVRVSGVRTGNGQVTTPDEIVILEARR